MSSGSQNNTTTVTQQIPAFEQGFATQLDNQATDLAASPNPVYNGQMIEGFSPQQQQSFDLAGQSANDWQPQIGAAQGMTMASAQPWNSNTAAQYMSPYVNAALQPTLQQLGIQQAQNQNAINASSTEAGAFGDARNGAATALNNFYGDLATNDAVGQAYNSAYTTGLGAYQAQQGQELNAATQMGNLGGLTQQLDLGGANALYNSGQQQQNLGQQELNNAYAQWYNQTMWPFQMQNMELSTLADTPYNQAMLTTAPPVNTTAQNLGAFGALAGGLGALTSGGKSGPFGGSAFSSSG